MPLDIASEPTVEIPQPKADAPIQFFDLKAQQALVREKVERRFTTILDHGRHIGGPEVEELETKLAEFTGAVDAVAVGSGTQALGCSDRHEFRPWRRCFHTWIYIQRDS